MNMCGNQSYCSEKLGAMQHCPANLRQYDAFKSMLLKPGLEIHLTRLCEFLSHANSHQPLRVNPTLGDPYE